MPDLAPRLDLPVSAVAEALQDVGRVVVTGPEGSGRSTLAGRLANEVEALVTVTVPELSEPDASVHTLLQLSAPLGDTAVTNGGSLDWINCGLCVDERGVAEAIEGVRRGTPADLLSAAEAAEGTLIIGTRG